MAYFNHAFQKTFLGGIASDIPPDLVPDAVATAAMLTDPAIGPGVTAVVNPQTNLTEYALLNAGGPSHNIYLAQSSSLGHDKIGPFHGGYQTTSKSKMINPKFVHSIYQVNCCEPLTNIIGIGASLAEDATQGEHSACCRTFQCDETYFLRIDLKGSPALRFLNHDMYHIASAYTGCCPDDDPTATVNAAVVYKGWVEHIVDTPTFWGVYGQWDQRMINIGVVVNCDDGQATHTIYLPNSDKTYFDDPTVAAQNVTADEFIARINTATGTTYTAALLSDLDPAALDTDECCSGIIMESAFVETKFDNCTFQVTDNYEIQPLIGQASMVDETGDPCEFEGVCIRDGLTPLANGAGEPMPAIQTALQANGTGEEILRSYILSQSYEQNFVANTDLRIREITQGDDLINAVNRDALYTSVYILHSIPRYNNPTGVFDNDQYLLRVVLSQEICNAEPGVPTMFAQDLVTWVNNANNIAAVERSVVIGCCNIITQIVPAG